MLTDQLSSIFSLSCHPHSMPTMLSPLGFGCLVGSEVHKRLPPLPHSFPPPHGDHPIPWNPMSTGP